MGNYDEVYRRSLSDPESFWAGIAEGIRWRKKWDRVLDDSRAPFYRWFVGGELNTCDNALDRHVDEGRGDQLALVWDSPLAGDRRSITYRGMRDEVARIAGGFANKGIGRGDRVIIYMPMVPEAVMAMLACARLGAVHSVVFGGFASHELAARIDHAQPKLIVSASCGLEPGNRIIPYKPLVDRALEIAKHRPEAGCIILQRPQQHAGLTAGRDTDWNEAVEDAKPVPCVPVAATDPLYVLYTSGTTGSPKGIVRDNGGHAVALRYSMKAIYGVEPGEVYWAASDIGWVVGHSYIVYAPLFTGARRSSTRANRSERPIRERSGGSSRSTACAPSSPRRPPSAPSSATTRTASTSAATIFPGCAPSSSPASAAIRTRSSGRNRSCASPSSTTGGRPRPAGRSAPIPSASSSSR